MKGIIKLILSDFKWYRKKKGGTWYLITFPDPNAVIVWVQIPPYDYYNVIMLNVERYG